MSDVSFMYLRFAVSWLCRKLHFVQVSSLWFGAPTQLWFRWGCQLFASDCVQANWHSP